MEKKVGFITELPKKSMEKMAKMGQQKFFLAGDRGVWLQGGKWVNRRH